jgi:hypothetical protein
MIVELLGLAFPGSSEGGGNFVSAEKVKYGYFDYFRVFRRRV